MPESPEPFNCPDCGFWITDTDTCPDCLFFWPYYNAPSAAFLENYPR